MPGLAVSSLIVNALSKLSTTASNRNVLPVHGCSQVLLHMKGDDEGRSFSFHFLREAFLECIPLFRTIWTLAVVLFHAIVRRSDTKFHR